ncbi:MAG TPA: chloride channel protein [Solirubrobacteraceae bacterium]
MSDRARRWSSYQPNVPGRGILAGYTWRFWLLIVFLGVVTGLVASALMGILRLTQRLAYGSHGRSFAADVLATTGRHRFEILLLAGLIVGIAAILFRLRPTTAATEVSEALWLRRGRLALVPSLARGVLSVVTVGLGSSLGREAAPQLAGASLASRLSDWAELPVWQRRLLVASGAGAGLAAVYNVPLGGALFALEVLLGTLALSLVLPALAVSVIATAVAWIFLGTAHSYVTPAFRLQASQMVWALVCGPLIGLAAVVWVRLIQRVNRLRPRGRGRLLVPLIVFGALGLLSIRYPELLGNGKGIVQASLFGQVSLGLFAVLLILKPLATAGCLGAGAPGGLFTPTLSIGVLLTGVLAGLWSHIWPHTVPAAYTLIGGAAFLAAAMQGPLSGVVLVLELTRHFDLIIGPALLATVEATVIARRFGAPTIYSARLAPHGYADEALGAAVIESLDATDESLPADPETAAGHKKTPTPDGSEGPDPRPAL